MSPHPDTDPWWAQPRPCLGHHDIYDRAAGDNTTSNRERDDAIHAAQALCATCPFTTECLQDAAQHPPATSGPSADYATVRGGIAPTFHGRGRPPKTSTNTPRPIEHGTEGGAKTHKRRGEQPCGSCRDAAAAASRARKLRAKTRAA